MASGTVPTVGRTRKKNTHLPKYVILYHGAYYYRGPATAWKRKHLGRVYADAMAEYGNLFRETGFDTMGDVFDKYALTVIPQKAPATQKSNELELQRLRLVFGRMRPVDVEPVECYAFRDKVATKSGVVQANNTLALLKHVFTKAIEWGATKVNPARDVRKIPVPARTRLPQRHELDLVYQHAPPVVQCAMTLAELTSMDRGGVLSLLMKHCRFEDPGIQHTRPKTRRRAARTVIIEWTDELRAVVKRAKALKPIFRQHLIATRSGKPMTPSGFSTLWQRAMVAAEKQAKEDGIEFERFHFHDIRAFSITETESLEEASQRAGHTSTEITQRVYRRKAARVKPLR
jgi:integrase